jgi:hypothetical protein
MRWNNLFDDLEGQLEHELSAEEVDLQAEEERLRLGRLSLRDRILCLSNPTGGSAPKPIRVLLANGDRIDVRPAAFGRDWFSADLVDESARRAQCIVPLAGIVGLVLSKPQVSASLRSEQSNDAARGLSHRLGLPFVLRDLCRRRKSLELTTTTASLFGTIDRVGRDHFDLAVHEPGAARRESAVQSYRVVVTSDLLLVRL